eukprot:m.538455 g.538455  ORF g.538455 m.538455 type:complete len:434 (-) comp22085_c0_seq1:1431-2732(-)
MFGFGDSSKIPSHDGQTRAERDITPSKFGNETLEWDLTMNPLVTQSEKSPDTDTAVPRRSLMRAMMDQQNRDRQSQLVPGVQNSDRRTTDMFAGYQDLVEQLMVQQKSNEDLQTENDMLKRQVLMTNTAKSAADAKMRGYELELNELQNTMLHLRMERDAAERSLKDLTATDDTSNDAFAKTMGASILRSKNALIEMKSAELISAHDENRDIKRRCAALQSKLETTEAELIRVTGIADSLQQQSEQTTLFVNTMVQKATELESARTFAEKKVGLLQTENEEQKEALECVRLEKEDLSLKLYDLRHELSVYSDTRCRIMCTVYAVSVASTVMCGPPACRHRCRGAFRCGGNVSKTIARIPSFGQRCPQSRGWPIRIRVCSLWHSFTETCSHKSAVHDDPSDEHTLLCGTVRIFARNKVECNVGMSGVMIPRWRG